MLMARSRPPTSDTEPTPRCVSMSSLICFLAISVISRRSRLPETTMLRIGVASMSNLSTTGESVPAGSCDRTVETLSRTSCAATSPSRSRTKKTTTFDTPFAGDRAQLVDALDGVDRLLDRLGDAALHLLDAGAAQRGGDGDDREVDVGEEIDPELPVREQPEHDQEADEHGRDDRAADAEIDDLHDVVRCSLFVGPLIAGSSRRWITANDTTDNEQRTTVVSISRRPCAPSPPCRSPASPGPRSRPSRRRAGLRSPRPGPRSSRVPMRTWRS